MVERAAEVDGLPVELLAPVVPEIARKRAVELLERHGIVPSAFVVLHPGGRGSAPRWAPEAFARLAQWLEAGGIACLFTGTGAEKALECRIQQEYPNMRGLFGATGIEEFIALLANARVVVGNSTGALHIAAALGVPVVGLYSRLPDHHPRRWGPYTQRAWILTPPPEAAPDAVDAIPVELVYTAVQHMWQMREQGEETGPSQAAEAYRGG
ncbi:MAG: glycosyltransferase family 9 protein, partial [Candidatus Kapabacteria bacterium]|nr:glycosyltransferase family 9 protein [Candidatus Kapabacteria bacterium]MDW7997200.1 glycosyltransferase family 9 protein [Bacteroidota bacterium]